jgi:diamine N-acetyltransferase
VVSCRPATPGDVPALSELAKRTWFDAFGHTVGADDAAAELELGRSAERFAEAVRTRAILVAEMDGELVGYAELGDVDIREVDVRPGDQEIHRLYVETALQGRGIGGVLMGEALRHPRVAGATRVFLQVWEENERAVRLYERLGFRTVGKTAFSIGSGEVVEDLVMVLERP